MGKRWTEDEEKIMAAHYPTARTVDEVAEMLGRPVWGVMKKGAALGLKRPDLHDVSIARLLSMLDNKPRSSGEIAARLGMERHSVRKVLGRAHKEGLCYIAEFRKESEGRGNKAAMWVLGHEENAVNELAQEQAERAAKRAAHAQKPFKAFRDPFSAALFGQVA